MSQPTSTFSKFVGLTSLGLLTGSSLTLSLLTTPTLLSLPSTTHASQAITVLAARTHSLHRFLSQTSLIALLAAWTLSPRESRHPYLLWTSLPILSLSGWQYWKTSSTDSTNTMGGVGNSRSQNSAKGKGKGPASAATGVGFGSGSEDEDGWRRIEEAEAAAGAAESINGEIVRDWLLAFRQANTVKSAAYGFAFMLGLVGIWGDGY